MEALKLEHIWATAGVILGFQITALNWRINRETTSAKIGTKRWFPVADYLNLVSVLTIVFGVFINPIFGGDLISATYYLGVALLFLVGYHFALIGHFNLFVPSILKNESPYFTQQEKSVVAGVLIIWVLYTIYFKSKVG